MVSSDLAGVPTKPYQQYYYGQRSPQHQLLILDSPFDNRTCSVHAKCLALLCVLLLIVCSGCALRSPQSYHAPWNEQLSIAYQVATVADPTVFLFNVTASPAGLYSQSEPIRTVFRFQTSTGQSIDVTLLDKAPKQSAKLVDMTGYDERRNTRRFRQALPYVRVSPAEALTIASSKQVRSTYDLTDRQPNMVLLLADDVPSSIGVPAVWVIPWTNSTGNQIVVWIDAQTGTIIDIHTRF